MKHFFLKSVKIGQQDRLRPVQGQTASDGSAILTSMNVQASKAMRSAYPVGTIFGTAMLENRGTFYSASDIFPMDLPLGQYQNQNHVPSKEMVDDWNILKGSDAYQNDELSGLDIFTGFPEGEDKPQGTTNAELPKKTKKKTLLDEIKSDKKYAVPTSDTDGFYVDEADWHFLVASIINRQNVMMVGPQGTGKTELVMLACQRLNLPCEVFDMGTTYDPVSTLLGVHRLMPGGQSVFDYAQFVHAIQQPGVVLLDELSRAPMTSCNLLFPVLDNRRVLKVEMAGTAENRVIPVHPECVFIATANIGAEHTGTYQLDAALKDRFTIMEMDYIPQDEEAKVLMKVKDIKQKDAALICKVADMIRNLKKKEEIEGCVSTRESLRAAQMVHDGWSVKDALQRIFLPQFEGTKTEGERSIVYKIFMSL